MITSLVSFGHCVIWRLRFTDSDYLFGIFWPLCCLSFFDLQILITPLVSFDHCVVWPSSIYRFWLLLSDLLAIVLSDLLRFTDSDYSFGVFWLLCCVTFFDLQILITHLVSLGHCVVSPSIYRFWLPLWYLLAIVSSDRLRITDSDYTFGIFWPLCFLTFFDLQILITPLVSFGHCVVWPSSFYRFWLLLWYLLAIVLSDLLRFTDSDYSFGAFWPLCCVTFFDLQIMITSLVSFGHCVVCSSLIYWFWLPLWYLLAIVLSDLLRFTDSDYLFGIFWPLCCLTFFDLQILITPLLSFGHCVVCPSSIYRLWLPLWYLLAIVLSDLLRFTDYDYLFGIFWRLCCLFFLDILIMITSLVSFGHCVIWRLRFTDSDYLFGIFWPLCCLSFFDLQILITPLVSFDHCVVWPSSIYRFWLLLSDLLAIVLSDLLRFTDSDYSFGVFWLLCCVTFFDLQILITHLVSLGHCVVSPSIYRFWLPLWYLLAIVSSDRLRITDSDYTFGIFWPLCFLTFFDLQILITPLVSFGHCVVWPSSIYRFWLLLWYLFAIVLSVLLRFTDSDYSFGIFWPLCFLTFFVLQILITPLVSFGHCVVWPSSIYRFWLHLWCLLAIVLSDLLLFTDSDYSFGIFWPLCCLTFFDLQILITPLVPFGHCVVWPSSIYRLWLPLWYLLAIVLSVLLWYTDSDYLFGIFWPLCCLTFFDLQILITFLVSFGHCVVWRSSIYRFWLLLCCLLAIVLSVLLRFTDYDYLFGIFWPLCCLTFFDLQIMITSLVSFGDCVVCSSLIYWLWLPLWCLLAIVLSDRLRFTDSDYLFGIFWPLCCLSFFDLQILITSLVSFGYCVVWPSSIYRFWLHIWYLWAIVLSVLRFTDSDYLFGTFWPLCRLTVFELQILITPLVSFGHCVFWPSSIYRFWLHIWYLWAIVLSVLRFTDSDYLFGTFWPLCRLTVFELQILITPLVSFGHCVFWPSSIYRFWLPLWYLLAIVLSDLLRFTDSDYFFGIFWPLCCLSFFDLQILITPLVSFGHCVVWPSSFYRFWLLLWYLLAIVLSDLLRFTDSDYSFGAFWPLCCVTFFDLQIMITSLVSFGHCVVCSSLIYWFWLPLWYLLAIVLSDLLRFTDSDYLFGIFWPLCCLTFFDLQILITPLLSFGHCVVCPSSIYRLWLPLWYLLAIVLSDLLRFTDYDYLFGIFWRLCCLFFLDILIMITSLVSFGHCVIWRLRFTDSDYLFGIFWPLCCLSFFDLQILITPLVSFDHCVVWPSSIYRFWLLLSDLLAIVLSDLLRFTDSDYSFGVFWLLCCVTFFDLQILITHLVSLGHCVVSPSIYRFWLPLWYLLAIVSSDRLRITDSDYTFGIFWPLCFLTFFDLQILITPLVSFGHCVVWPSSIYRFWLLLWYLLAIVLSVLLRFTDSDYSFGIFWPLCCLTFFVLQILITPLVSFGHCVVWPSSIYRFWLHLWCLLAIVLSDLLLFTDSDYSFGIFWPLCCLTFFDLQILITPLVPFGHCVVWPSSIYRLWLPLWYLLAIVLSVLLWYTDSDYLFGIFWPLCCLTFFDLQILITFLVSFGHCVVWRSSIYRFWLLLCCLLAIVLSVLLRFTDYDYLFGIFWPLCCLTFFDLQIMITSLVSFGDCVVCSSLIYWLWLPLWCLLAIVLSDRLRFTDSDYLFGIFWPLCCLSFFDLQILITSLVSFGYCVVWPSSIYRFWLHIWYLWAIVLSVLRFTDSDYLFGTFWPLCRLTVFELQILITPLVSFGHCVFWPSSIYRFWLPLWYLLAIVLSDLLRFTDSDCSFGIFWPLCCLSFFDLQILITPLVSFGHCVVWPSSFYRFWLLLWYLLAIVLSDLLRFTDSDYTFGVFWPLCCLTFFYLQILITPLVSFGHCVVWPSSFYRFWLLLWYLLAIVLSDLLRFTDSDYSFGVFWPLCCLTFFDLQILITPLVSFDHCVVCPSSIYRFLLLLWCLLAIVLPKLPRFTDSDYTFGIFWPLCCVSFFDLQILITPLVSFGHCVVCPSIYRFWLLLWYLLAIVLCFVLRFTDSDYSFGILWPLCCLSFFDLRFPITPLVSFGHCDVWPSSIYRFLLTLWYLLAIVLSVLLRFTHSDYPFGVFWPLCCLTFFDLQILITSLVSFSHCDFWPSSIYRFLLTLWYLLAIVLSVLLRFTDSDYPFGIFWPLCCVSFFDLWILITPLVSFGHCVVCPSSIYRFWLLFGIFWPLCCVSFFDLQILITPLVSFGHCVVCPFSIYRFWLLLCHLVAIVLSVLLWFTVSDYPFGIFWPLWYLTFFYLQIFINPLVSFGHCVVCPSSIYRFWLPLWCLLAIVLSDLLRFTDPDYSFGIFWPLCCLTFFDLHILITPLVSFGHCVVWPSSIYRFWILLWYLLAIVLSDLLRFTDSDYSFGVFWPLCCVTFFDLQILITPLVSFGHCVVCPSSIYRFWLLHWYLLAIVLPKLPRFTDSDYTFGIFWPLCCVSFFDLQILITPLVSFGHCVVCPSIYRFWLLLWYLLAIVLCFVLRFRDPDYSFGIFWPLCCLSFFDLRFPITPLVSFGHCDVWPSSIYRFLLTLWYLLAIVLSVLLRFTDSDYPFGVFWPLCCLTFFDLQILITSLVSFGHCDVWSSSIYRFLLTLWCLLAIVLFVLLRFTVSDYPFGIFWPLCCVSFFDLEILITPLVSFGHCVVCPSSIYRFWLLLWYLLAIVLCFVLRFTDPDYTFGIFWPLCCLSFDLQILITPLASCGHCVVCPSLIYGFRLPLWYLLAIVMSDLLRFTDFY